MHYLKLLPIVFLISLLSACGRQLDDVDTSVDLSSVDTSEAIRIPDDPLIALVADADITNGEALFVSAVPACSSCHTTSEDQLIGPGLANITLNALVRDPNLAPHRYIYNSIINPSEYVVDGFATGMMPDLYEDALTEEERVDLVAYLMSLTDASLEFEIGDPSEFVQPDVVEATEEAPADDTVVAEATEEAPADDIVIAEETEVPADDTIVVEATEEPVEPTLPFDVPDEVIVYGDLSEDRVTRLVTVGIPDNGEALFSANCAGCHYSDSLDTLEAVGLGGVPSALAEFGSDYPAEIFFYNGILDPAFHPDLENGFELGTSEIFDLIAYLMLQENSTADVVDTETTETETTEPADDAPEIVSLVANADPTNGETLFSIGDPAVGALACTTCHLADSTAMLVGPGMLNVGEVSTTRIEGLTAEEYLYESIVNPNDFITEGFAGGMLATYGDQYSDEQIYDIIAYLLTLTD